MGHAVGNPFFVIRSSQDARGSCLRAGVPD